MLRPLALVLLVSGCAQHFAHVDFKYDSNAHLHPADTRAQLSGTPAEAMDRVAAFAAAHGGTITKRKADQPPLRIAFPADAEQVWQAKRDLFEKEWHTFEKDDPESYFAIDRNGALLNRPLLQVRHDGVSESISMRIEFPARQGKLKITRDMGPLIPVWWTEVHTVDIAPVVYVFAWTVGDGSTWIYARGTPRIGTVEAGAPKAWCDHSLWTASTGFQEAMLVRELLEALK
jgi:hypothetical protein